MIRNFRNKVDFFIRNRVRLGRPLSDESELTFDSAQWQQELYEFFDLFEWEHLLPHEPVKLLQVADIGAKTFIAGPVIERHLARFNLQAEIHGIEIDAFRRFTSLRTRFDYGQFYASKIQQGHYHAMDFLDWRKPLDIAFLLHPFVTPEPLLAWGLPMSKFKPLEIFKNVRQSLSESNLRLLLLSCPTPEELHISRTLARDVGFKEVEAADWQPSASNVQKKPRLGLLLKA